ncbi:hypothetical protein JKP88DRAFT_241132 [Tribonema minus]|uniref:Uncharacterized protein n=1 Tax=Tribonema minus TaxID=303371 RepID=A0A835Z484_9STRA|nr:hypothetical protein JKP88DRAFT_241132 [Tribonema minus]
MALLAFGMIWWCLGAQLLLLFFRLMPPGLLLDSHGTLPARLLPSLPATQPVLVRLKEIGQRAREQGHNVLILTAAVILMSACVSYLMWRRSTGDRRERRAPENRQQQEADHGQLSPRPEGRDIAPIAGGLFFPPDR